MIIRNLYSFYWDCGRAGDLDGLFVATQEELDQSYGSTVDFGECLGKHSEVYGELEPSAIEYLSGDQEKIDWLVEMAGGTTISGYNPLHYVRKICSDEDCGEVIYEYGDWYCEEQAREELLCDDCYKRINCNDQEG